MPRRGDGKKFMGNTNKKEVHDLDNEQTNCQIDEIIRAGHRITFNPDTVDEARSQGYDRCHWCLGDSTG